MLFRSILIGTLAAFAFVLTSAPARAYQSISGQYTDHILRQMDCFGHRVHDHQYSELTRNKTFTLRSDVTGQEWAVFMSSGSAVYMQLPDGNILPGRMSPFRMSSGGICIKYDTTDRSCFKLFGYNDGYFWVRHLHRKAFYSDVLKSPQFAFDPLNLSYVYRVDEGDVYGLASSNRFTSGKHLVLSETEYRRIEQAKRATSGIPNKKTWALYANTISGKPMVRDVSFTADHTPRRVVCSLGLKNRNQDTGIVVLSRKNGNAEIRVGIFEAVYRLGQPIYLEKKEKFENIKPSGDEIEFDLSNGPARRTNGFDVEYIALMENINGQSGTYSAECRAD